MDSAGVPTGIDIGASSKPASRRPSIPALPSGTRHRQVGAGVAAPLACFEQGALAVLAARGERVSATLPMGAARGFYPDSVALMQLSREVARNSRHR